MAEENNFFNFYFLNLSKKKDEEEFNPLKYISSRSSRERDEDDDKEKFDLLKYNFSQYLFPYESKKKDEEEFYIFQKIQWPVLNLHYNNPLLFHFLFLILIPTTLQHNQE